MALGVAPLQVQCCLWRDWQFWSRAAGMEKVRRQAENEWPRVETVPCRATPGTPHSRLQRRGWEKERICLVLRQAPSFQAFSHALYMLPPGGVTPWNWGHAGGGESPRGTYQGTGRCNQGQGLCNSGWRRSWLGNLGNLMGRRGNMRYRALVWGTASLDLWCS